MASKNPWLSIWTKPRSTIREIVSEDPNRSLWWLAAIYGFSSLLNAFQSMGLGNQVGVFAIFFIALILAPFWGYAMFSAWSWTLLWTGKLFKGKGSFQKVRAAYSWSCVPLTINGILWMILIFYFGSFLFSTASQGAIFSGGDAAFLFIILSAKVVLAIWGLVIYLNSLSEVQEYSILRAIGNCLLAGIVWMAVFFGIAMLSVHLFAMVVNQPNMAFELLHIARGE